MGKGPENQSESETFSRRDFLKAAAVGSGLVAMETSAEAQERTVADNHIELYTEGTDNTKIDFPEKPEKITPQIEAILLAIQNYQLALLRGTELSQDLLNNSKQTVIPPDEKEVLPARISVWSELKKFDPALPDFSNEEFYKTMAQKVPGYLAKYGIYGRPKTGLWSSDAKPDIPASIDRAEILFTFLEIGEVKHDEVEQWGKRISRDIVYIKGPLIFSGRVTGTPDVTAPAENGFRNIMVYEQALKSQFESIASSIDQIESQVAKYPKGQFIDLRKADLEQSNDWDDAVEIGLIKLIERMKVKPDYETYHQLILSHETRHLVDRDEGDLRNAWPIKVTTNPSEQSLRQSNLRFHDEINPMIAEIRYGLNREFALFFAMSSARNTPDVREVEKIPNLWIFRNMVRIISQNPESYGINISETTKVSKTNQIASQLDVLLDRPQMLDELCQKLIEEHKLNISADLSKSISLAEVQNADLEPQSSNALYKIGIPAAVVGGGALYALKKFGERKEKVSRQQRRQESRKNKKG